MKHILTITDKDRTGSDKLSAAKQHSLKMVLKQGQFYDKIDADKSMYLDVLHASGGI